MARVISCIVEEYPSAARIISELKDAGFQDDDISVLMHDRADRRDVMHERITETPDSAAKGAMAGAGAGGLIGGVAGLVAGLAALAIPGVGPLLAIGPIFTALSGAAVGAAFGGLTGTMVGLGVPEIEARRYESRLASGGVFVSVHAENDEELRTARDILQRGGAIDISASSEDSTRAPLPNLPQPAPIIQSSSSMAP